MVSEWRCDAGRLDLPSLLVSLLRRQIYDWSLCVCHQQVGVVPDTKLEVLKGALVCESLVARCLWESHWREEWCGVYRKSFLFYAPLTQKPCLELCTLPFVFFCSSVGMFVFLTNDCFGSNSAFSDVQSVRLLDIHQRSPLPGFPILAIETAWQCHYLAFPSEESRENFRMKIQILIPKRSTSGTFVRIVL